ncbi:MAG: hypothetical protein RI637_03895 [Acidimicrobiia bacterium]|nr:hypothetical protein [Acidimicrobiia bacterium]
MSEILEQEQTVSAPIALPARSRVVEFTLAILGFVVAIAGAYLLFAPDDWWLGDLAEAWYMGAFIIGGVLVMIGLGVYANESYLEDDSWTARVVTGLVVALLGMAGAITAALMLIL